MLDPSWVLDLLILRGLACGPERRMFFAERAETPFARAATGVWKPPPVLLRIPR